MKCKKSIELKEIERRIKSTPNVAEVLMRLRIHQEKILAHYAFQVVK